ncbi:glycine-rich protein [Pontibacter sp. H249]|uniref:glycine-rich protein n=1 Tax=Pontibacter sp. H249 TaxID=3133420 RepID=UPI0030BC34BA
MKLSALWGYPYNCGVTKFGSLLIVFLLLLSGLNTKAQAQAFQVDASKSYVQANAAIYYFWGHTNSHNLSINSLEVPATTVSTGQSASGGYFSSSSSGTFSSVKTNDDYVLSLSGNQVAQNTYYGGFGNVVAQVEFKANVKFHMQLLSANHPGGGATNILQVVVSEKLVNGTLQELKRYSKSESNNFTLDAFDDVFTHDKNYVLQLVIQRNYPSSYSSFSNQTGTISLKLIPHTSINAISDDRGDSANDAVTNDGTIKLHGFSKPGATVTVYRDGSVIGTTLVSDSENWTFDYTATDLPEGIHTFKASAVDKFGNSLDTSDDFIVRIDKTAPSITAPNAVTVSTDAGKNIASGITLGSPVTADNHQVAFTVNDAPITFPLGNTTVVWTVADIAGNIATASQVVTVKDTEVPSIKLKNISLALNANGSASLKADDLNDGTTDNVSNVTLSFKTQGKICATANETGSLQLTAPQGAVITSITFASYGTPTGTCGNFSIGSCHAVNSKSIVESLALGKNSVTIAADNSIFGDPCSFTPKRLYVEAIYEVETSTIDFNCNNLGDNKITVYATDANGNSANAEATVTVVDNIKPSSTLFAAPTSILTNVPEAAKYNLAYSLDIPNNANWDTQSQVPYAVNNAVALQGKSIKRIAYALELDNKWVWVSMDAFTQDIAKLGIPTGSIAFQQKVDNMNVVASANTGITNQNGITTGNVELWSNCYVTGNATNLPGANSGTYDFDDTRQEENCYGSFQIHNYGTRQTFLAYNAWSNNQISDLGIGNRDVNHPDWTFASNANTYTTKKLHVFVQVEETMIAKDVTVYLDTNGKATISSADVVGVVTDNCGIATLSVSPDKFTAANIGANTVTITAKDVNGNEATATATVTVVDNTNPVFTSTQNNVIVALDAVTGTASLVDYAALATATDNSGTVTITQSPAAGTALVKDVVTTVILTATDIAGNKVAQTFTVTATDQTAPVPNVANLATITEECSATVTAPTATDNVAGTVTGTTTDPLTYTTQGEFTIKWTYNDGSGNTTTQTQQVIIKDETAPVFAAVSPITQSNDADKCGAVITYTTPTATDNCSSLGAATQQTFNYTGSVQSFTAPVTGKYILETWGAQGGNDPQSPTTIFGGRGGYAKGEVTLTAGTTLYIYVGGQGTGSTASSWWSTGGGGATDVRLVGGTWNDNASLYSRIIVAGGGGGRHGKNYETPKLAYLGNDGGGANAPSFTTSGYTINGSSQDNGGNTSYPVKGIGAFGFAVPITAWSNSVSQGGWNGGGRGNDNSANGGAGGGWYGGVTSWPTSSGGSGYVLTADSYKPVGYTPTSDYYFSNIQLIAGNANMPNPAGGDMIGRLGNGIAVISYKENTVSVTQTAGLASGSLFPVGTTTNTFEATDAAGNKSQISFDVTVTDTQKPTVITQNITVELDENGTGTITAAQINNGSTDNCSIPANGYSLDKYTFSCADAGTNTVTLTVTDANGNSDSKTAIVTVVDNLAPVAKAKNITVQLDENGTATIVAADVNDGSSDNCSIVSYTLNKYTFGCSDTGANTVTLTVKDAKGNEASTKATVTVEDKIVPTAIAKDITVQLDATGAATITAAQIDNGSSDNCGIDTIVLDKTNFTCSDIGANKVMLTVKDVNGLTSTVEATVTVEDKVDPIVITQNITVELDENGTATITAAMVNNGSTDNCSIPANGYSLDKYTFSCADAGTNTVTLTVTDANGNSDSKTAIVTVKDVTVPTVVTKNITVKLDAAGKAIIVAADVDGGSSDVCGSVVLTIDKTTFGCSNVGDNTVKLTVTDRSGNFATQEAVVTVVDEMAPIVATQNIIVNLDATGKATITAAQIDNGSTDNCGIASRTLDVTEFTCENVGDNTVTLTVTDVNGNEAKLPATVTIVDEIAPNAFAKRITVSLDANGTATITADQVNDNSADNCGIKTLTLDNYTFGCSNVGDNTVTLTVTDKAGNKSTATATVTVEDNAAPTITAPANVVVDVDAGKNTASNVVLGTPATADNCSVASVTNDAPAVYPTGTTTVTWTVTDASGNTSTATQTVIVRRDVVGVAQLAKINVPIRTTYANVPLPANVVVTYSNGETATVGITWAQGTYNGLVAGNYTLSGQLVLEANTTNTTAKAAAVTVVVEPNKVPTALAFSATTFKPEAKGDDVIGTLTTTDPDDNQFVYTLVSGNGDTDNNLFEIRGDKVYLKSNKGLSGQLQFTFRVRSTDPYQNTIEKTFTLSKGKYEVAEDKLKIVNAFSPNNDGINDTWFIPELRFYNSVEVEVFDRSGVRIFHTTDPEKGWDGRSLNGQVLKGAFFYIVQVKDINLVKKGVVTIISK